MISAAMSAWEVIDRLTGIVDMHLKQGIVVGTRSDVLDEGPQSQELTLHAMLVSSRRHRYTNLKWKSIEINEIPFRNMSEGTIHEDGTRSEGWNEGWTLRTLIAYVNKLRNQQYIDRKVDIRSLVAPLGLHVYKTHMFREFINDAVRDQIEYVYEHFDEFDRVPRRFDDDNLIFLGYPKESMKSYPRYRESMQIIESYGEKMDKIKNMVLYYSGQLKKIFNIGDEVINECSLSIVRYDGDKHKGIKQHIDGFSPSEEDEQNGTLRDYLGPLVTIALRPGKKQLDFFPLITTDKEARCLRLTADMGDIVIMDGQARVEYAHSVPFDTTIRYSLCYKFKQFQRKYFYGEWNEILKTEIIYSIPLPRMEENDLPPETPMRANPASVERESDTGA
jgi:hypothetical protein